jgi:hypothetical protein
VSDNPYIGSFAQSAYDRLGPWTRDDVLQQWALAYYLGTFGSMVQDVEDVARDTDEGDPGWSAVLDIGRAPTHGLPWLAQFVGVRLDAAQSDSVQRAAIIARDGWSRGTVRSIVAAAQSGLTGDKKVLIRERHTSAYHFSVVTYTDETPDSVYVEAQILAAKPAGLTFDYDVFDGQDYEQLYNDNATYADVFANFATYDELATHTF